MLRCWPQSTLGIRRACNAPNPACPRLQKNSGPALTRNLSPCRYEKPSTLSARSSVRRMLKRFSEKSFPLSALESEHLHTHPSTASLQPDAEHAHHLVLRQLSILPPLLVQTIFGRLPCCPPHQLFWVTFPRRVGLAAGMDKNGIALRGWEALGFGFVEIGTITARPQPGNARPRLFRYPEQAALVNRMGFNNDGADVIAARLDRLRKTGKWPTIPVGINLGKSKNTPLDEASADYLHSFRALRSLWGLLRDQRELPEYSGTTRTAGNSPLE